MIPRDNPCGSCPYRTECPSGVWHESEYAKLPEYDGETWEQPTGVFMCHDAADGQTICRGWLDCHDKGNLLALRHASSLGLVGPEIYELPPSGVAVFASGQEAADHGLRDVLAPGERAARVVDKIRAKRGR